MKIVNKVLYVLAAVFGLASLALFFTNFATIYSGDTAINFVGAALGFGAKKTLADGTVVNMAISADILFCFMLTAIGFLVSVFAVKSQGARYFSPAFGLGSAIYMLVIALSNPWKFVDTRSVPAIENISGLEYNGLFVLITAICLFVFAALGIAYLLVDDYIRAKEGKGRKTIFARLVSFFRDYKSELKKIVWPGPRDIVKNTAIVLVMCLIIGALIWALDFGLGQLINLILDIKAS